jgi:hypothetical protein
MVPAPVSINSFKPTVGGHQCALASAGLAGVVDVAARSHHNPLDLIERKPVLGTVIELRGARALVRCHRLRVLQRATVGEIRRDPGRPKAVVADRRRDAGGDRALAHHAPGIDLGHRLIGERGSSVPPAGAEQKRLLVGRDAGGGDVGVQRLDTSTLVGLRDRALIGVMTYAFARIGAVVAMRVEDYFANGKRWWVRLHEKGGKRHEMPAHHKLEALLDEYIRTAGIAGDDRSPLFRSAVRRTGTLAATAMHRVDAWRMVQRRAAELGMKVKIGCHTFRATGITAYLEAGGTLENAQAMQRTCAAALRSRPRSLPGDDRCRSALFLREVMYET